MLNSTIKKIFILYLFLFTTCMFSQDFDPDPNIDEVPINGLVAVGLIAGAALGLRKSKK